MAISVIGSTGSIGTQTLDVAEKLGIHILALTANTNVKLLERQVRKTGAGFAAVADEASFSALRVALADTSVKLSAGEKSIAEIASLPVKTLVNAAVGIAGLRPTEAAILAGNNIALANKETIVAGGEYICRLAKEHHVQIIPVDSEHSAIFQCLQTLDGGFHVGERDSNHSLKKIILTCSGGAFFGKTAPELENITPGDIYNPNWDMGKKVTLDSATLANKGLELIEAVRLFGVSPSQVEIVIHRESVLHSAVEFADGAVIAELGSPDMRIPIQYALTFPDRFPSPAKSLSLTDLGKLTFSTPDYATFTALSAFRRALDQGGAYPAIASAVNDAAGRLFFAGKLRFPQIADLIASSLSLPDMPVSSVSDILSADAAGKALVRGRWGKGCR